MKVITFLIISFEISAAKASLTVAPEEEAELLDEDDPSTVENRQTITTIVPLAEKQSEENEKPEIEYKDESKSSAEVIKPDISKMTQEEVCHLHCFSFILIEGSLQKTAFRCW